MACVWVFPCSALIRENLTMLTSESVGIELRERRSEQSLTIWRPSVITSLASKAFSVCSKAFLTAQAKASKQAALLLIEISIYALQMLFCYGEFYQSCALKVHAQ